MSSKWSRYGPDSSHLPHVQRPKPGLSAHSKKLQAKAIWTRWINPPGEVVPSICEYLDHASVYEHPELESVFFKWMYLASLGIPAVHLGARAGTRDVQNQRTNRWNREHGALLLDPNGRKNYQFVQELFFRKSLKTDFYGLSSDEKSSWNLYFMVAKSILAKNGENCSLNRKFGR